MFKQILNTIGEELVAIITQEAPPTFSKSSINRFARSAKITITDPNGNNRSIQIPLLECAKIWKETHATLAIGWPECKALRADQCFRRRLLPEPKKLAADVAEWLIQFGGLEAVRASLVVKEHLYVNYCSPMDPPKYKWVSQDLEPIQFTNDTNAC